MSVLDLIEGHIDINTVPPAARGRLLCASVAWNIVTITDKAIQVTGKHVKNPHDEAMLGMAIAAADLLLFMQKKSPHIVDAYVKALRDAVDKKITAGLAMADVGLDFSEIVKVKPTTAPTPNSDDKSGPVEL